MASETETRYLIERLANEATPVRRLRSPLIRTALWLSLSLPFIAVVVVLMQPRPDLALKLAETRFLLEQGGALLTAVTAAAAALALVVPGADRRWVLVPLVPGGLWLGTLGAGCLADALRAGPVLAGDAECLLYIAVAGSVPAAALVAMLRRGAPLAPRGTLFLAVLAAAALGNFGLRFFHLQDAGLMVLVWQFGSVLLLAGIAGLCGPRFLSWRHCTS